jgi:hypothetical protein
MGGAFFDLPPTFWGKAAFGSESSSTIALAIALTIARYVTSARNLRKKVFACLLKGDIKVTGTSRWFFPFFFNKDPDFPRNRVNQRLYLKKEHRQL